MTLRILMFLAAGIILGRWMPFKSLIPYLDSLVTIGLCVLLFFVGIDIGKSKDLLKKLKREGWGILILPFAVALGSIGGSLVAGWIIRLSPIHAGAVGAGMGWYTLSAVILAKVDTRLGALAFLTNVFREVIAIMLIPWLAKRFGGMIAVAPAGATAMDTTLPIITRAAGSEMAIIAFLTGAILSAVVPFLVPLIISLG